MCIRAAQSTELHILFVFMQPLVEAGLTTVSDNAHSTDPDLGWCSIITLNLNIIFQLFLVD